MSILILVPFYGRQRVSDVFAAGVDRLRKNWDIEALAIVSTPEDKVFCESKGYHVLMYDNRPLGRKMNAGIKKALSLPKWRRMLIMGSDDLISTTGFDLLLRADNLISGFRSMYVYDVNNHIGGLFEYQKGTRTIGAGRLIHREVLENTFARTEYRIKRSADPVQIGFKIAQTMQGRGFGSSKGSVEGIWDDVLNSNLDNSMETNLAMLGYPITCVESDQTHILDIKTEHNIHPYGILVHHECSTIKTVTGYDWFLSGIEKRLLQELK